VVPDGFAFGLWTGPGGIAFGAGGRLYVADPVTGLRWSVPGLPIDALVTRTDVISLQFVPGPAPNTELTDVFDRRLGNAAGRWVRTDSALALVLPSGPDFLLLEGSYGVDARTLAAGALAGTVPPPGSGGQYEEAAAVDGADTLIQANPFICVSAG
jgi:hypothetical protein